MNAISLIFSTYVYFRMDRPRLRPFVLFSHHMLYISFLNTSGLYMLLISSTKTLTPCYLLSLMKLIYVHIVFMEVHLFIHIYYLRTYGLFMLQMIHVYLLTRGFIMSCVYNEKIMYVSKMETSLRNLYKKFLFFTKFPLLHLSLLSGMNVIGTNHFNKG